MAGCVCHAPDGLDRGHARAEAAHGFGDEPAAAADIEQAQPLQRFLSAPVAVEMRAGAVADIGEADRIEFVQRLEFAEGVPPFIGDG